MSLPLSCQTWLFCKYLLISREIGKKNFKILKRRKLQRNEHWQNEKVPCEQITENENSGKTSD